MTTQTKPLPQPSPETLFFWEGAKRHELWLPYCLDCNRSFFYPRPFCPHCGGVAIEWRQASGTGTIYSYVINHAPAPGFAEDVPYVIALVELTEGPRMMTNIVNVTADPAHVSVGMPVRVVFRDVSEEITLPLFEPAPAQGGQNA